MKVCQEIDVDNVTIIINPQNKLEAKIPTSTPSEVVIEEINANLLFTSDQGLVVHRNDTNTNHPLTKLGRVKGTDWLVVRAKDVFGDVKPVPEETISETIGWSASGSDNGDVTYIKDGNNIVGVTTQLNFDRTIPAGMSFDVNFELNKRLIKTVTVVSEGQSEFTVTTGKTDFSFDTSDGATPGGRIYINNEKNVIHDSVRHSIIKSSSMWVGKMGRDF